MSGGYVHGYHPRENERLQDQAGLPGRPASFRHCIPKRQQRARGWVRRRRPDGRARATQPDARRVSIDISAESLAEARRRTERAGLTNVEFRQADLFALPFHTESFDHVFVCFVLEHQARPAEALAVLEKMLSRAGRSR